MVEFSSKASRWAAVQSRDPAADTVFVYSVRTTRIYCRPTCKARLARQSNVTFHDTPKAAEADGYRACKRCRPELVAYEPRNDVVLEACGAIRAAVEAGERRSLKQLAGAAGLTSSHFHRVFKSVMGVTPKEYRSVLLVMDAHRSRESRETVTDLLVDQNDCSSSSGDSSAATPPGGLPPRIEFTIQAWLSSYVLIAAMDDRICAIHVSDHYDDLVPGLQRRFPDADLVASEWAGLSTGAAETAQPYRLYGAVMEALESPSGRILDVTPHVFEAV